MKVLLFLLTCCWDKISIPQLQIKLDKTDGSLIRPQLAVKAWRKIPDAGVRENSFANIRQGPQEPYIGFIDRLQTAITKQIDNEEAVTVLLFQLAYENANSDCQAVLTTVKGRVRNIGEYVKLCQNISTESHKAAANSCSISIP